MAAQSRLKQLLLMDLPWRRLKKQLVGTSPSIVVNVTKFSIAARPGRPKKSATPPEDTKPTNKRKKSEETDEEPEPVAKKTKAAPPVKKHKPSVDGDDESKPTVKKTKTRQVKAKAKTPEDDKPQPKGPRRIGGRKNDINAIRYTDHLKVFVFGEGGNGELGLGASKKSKDVKRPRFNEKLTNMNVVKIATGGMHVVALTSDNKIVTWGVNDNGALGRETPVATVPMRDMDADDSGSDDDETGGLNEAEATPTAISDEYFPPDTVFVDVAAGDSCSFALTTEGAVYGWGTFRVSISF